MESVFCLDDFDTLARELLPHPTFEFIASGAADQHSLAWNIKAWSEIRLKPRVLVDTTQTDTSVNILGVDLPSPIILAPTAYQRMVHPEGEIASVRGAGTSGALYMVST